MFTKFMLVIGFSALSVACSKASNDSATSAGPSSETSPSNNASSVPNKRYVETWNCKVVSMTGMINMPAKFQVTVEGASHKFAVDVPLNIDIVSSQTSSLTINSETIEPATDHKFSTSVDVTWIEFGTTKVPGSLQFIRSKKVNPSNVAILFTGGEQGLFTCQTEIVFKP